jgi:hypothetical protein
MIGVLFRGGCGGGGGLAGVDTVAGRIAGELPGLLRSARRCAPDGGVSSSLARAMTTPSVVARLGTTPIIVGRRPRAISSAG